MTAEHRRTATPELVHQLVADVRRQLGNHEHPEPLVVGARARPEWTHGVLDYADTGRIAVAGCPTPLAARTALADHATGDPTSTLVVLTDLPEQALGVDILARFVRPRLLPFSPWSAVEGRFGVTRLDPIFNDERYSWMAEALLDVPTSLVKPGTSLLSVELGLTALARHILGANGTSIERLLLASARPDFVSSVQQHEPRIVDQLCRTLAERLGPAGELALGVINSTRGELALPAGLAARTLLASGGMTWGHAKVAELTGVSDPTDAALGAWARASELAFAELAASDESAANDVSLAGSALAREWKAEQLWASSVLAVGFEARLELLAQELNGLLDGARYFPMSLRLAVQGVLDHREAASGPNRARAARAQLAARLVSWLRDPASNAHGVGLGADGVVTPLNLVTASAAYVDDGAWVDAARRRVGEGDDGPPEFAAVLRRISEQAHDARAIGNRAFADALARWSTDGTANEMIGSRVVPVERVLDELIAPIAAQQPVLLVVLDGCGLPAFYELADQMRSLGLHELGQGSGRLTGLAVLPTVTEVSRTSLLCGSLRTGSAADEKRELPRHLAIAALPGPTAEVFHHRPDLVSGVGQGLPDHVKVALGADGPRVVAAVVNTIDDELSRGTFTSEYRLENLGPLPALLRLAAQAGRLVLVAADHGHVLGVGLDGRGEVLKSGEGGDRWRVADRAPTEDEVRVRGPRVLLGDDAGVLMPWHDDLRYSAKHGGYHGGATPDECLVPLSLFAPLGVSAPKGWDQLGVAPPAWWDLSITVEATTEVPGATKPKTPKKRPPENQGSLFVGAAGSSEPAEAPAVDATAPVAVAAAPWLDELLASENYGVQLGSLGRAKPPEDRVRATLDVLHTRGGVASFAVIAQETGQPMVRISGFLSVLTRLLNVDGYAVLTVDNSAEEARLDENLLLTQFLGGGG